MTALLKFALLITPSVANVEQRFSTLTLLCMKQINHLSLKNTNPLMQITLLVEKPEDPIFEGLIDKCKNMKKYLKNFNLYTLKCCTIKYPFSKSMLAIIA